jgi:hypothetical protein
VGSAPGTDCGIGAGRLFLSLGFLLLSSRRSSDARWRIIFRAGGRKMIRYHAAARTQGGLAVILGAAVLPVTATATAAEGAVTARVSVTVITTASPAR